MTPSGYQRLKGIFKSRKNDVTKRRTRNTNHRTYSDSRLYCEYNSGRIRCDSCRAGLRVAGAHKAIRLHGRFLLG